MPRIRAHDYLSLVYECEERVAKSLTKSRKVKPFAGVPPRALQRPAWKKNFISHILRLVSLEAAVETCSGKVLNSEYRKILEHVCLYFHTLVNSTDKAEFDCLTRRLTEAGEFCCGLVLSKKEVSLFSEAIKKLQPFDLLNISTVPLLNGTWWDDYRLRHPLAKSKTHKVPPELAASYQNGRSMAFQRLEHLKTADVGGSLCDITARLVKFSWTSSVMKSGIPFPTFDPDHPHTTAFKKLQSVKYNRETEFLTPKEVTYLYEMYKDIDTLDTLDIEEAGENPLPPEEEHSCEVMNALCSIDREIVIVVDSACKEIDDLQAALDPLFKLMSKATKDASPEKRLLLGETQAILDSVQDKKITAGKHSAKGFDDPSLRCDLDSASRDKLAHMFACWVEQYPPEIKDAVVSSKKSLEVVFHNIGKRFRDADHHFRKTDGHNDPVPLSAFEASAIFRSYWALEQSLAEMESRYSVISSFVKTRWTTINAYNKLIDKYHDKVQELMWVAATKKIYLYGNALDDRQLNSTDIATLKIESEVQAHKAALLTAQLDLLVCMNSNAQKTIDSFIKRDERMYCSKHRDSHDTGHEAHLHDWQAYEKELDTKKQVIQRTLKRSMTSDMQCSALLDNKVWQLMEILFNEVKKNGGKRVAARLVQQVFGNAIEIVQDPLPDTSFEEYISNIQSITGPELEQEVSALREPQKVIDLKLTTALKGFYPPVAMECSTGEQEAGDWCFVPQLEMSLARQELNIALNESALQADKWVDAEEFARRAALEAQRFRELYDSHLLECKKSAARGDGAVKRFRDWTDATILRSSLPFTMSLQSDKEKLNYITDFIKCIIVERDEALRKIRSLNNKNTTLGSKLESKDKELAHAQNVAQGREDCLKANLKSLESQLEDARASIQKMRRESEQTLAARQKKLQDSFDKNADLKKELDECKEGRSLDKLDHDATRSAVEKAEAAVNRSKKALKEGSEKFQVQKKELEKYKSEALMLRSNDKAEKDRIKKAVLDAEALKDAEIAEYRAAKDAETTDLQTFYATKISELEDQISCLHQERLVDEDTIRELSRYKESRKQKDSEIESYQRQVAETDRIYAQQVAEMVEDHRLRVQWYKGQLEAHRASTNKLIAANDRVHEAEIKEREKELSKALSKAEMQVAMLKAVSNGGMDKWSNWKKE